VKKSVRARTSDLLLWKHAATPVLRVPRSPGPDTLSLKTIAVVVAFVFLVFSTPSSSSADADSQPGIVTADAGALATDTGASIDIGKYLVLEASGGDITSRGSALCGLLEDHGIVCTLEDVSSLSSEALARAQVVILDGSCGSSSGTLLSDDAVSLLTWSGRPLVLIGRAAWVLHRLRDTGPPSVAAPLATTLEQHVDYSGAVFLEHPEFLSLGGTLTSESGLALPIDAVQTSTSRLVNLTLASSGGSLAPLRYVSLPCDILLFGPENPNLLTITGEGLLVNAIAYASVLGESPIAYAVGLTQSDEASSLPGGFSYSHTPSVDSTYHAVHAVHSLMSASEFVTWCSANEELIDSILGMLLVDSGTETGFRSSLYGTTSLTATAQALWLISAMNLELSHDMSEIVTYLSTRQSADGGFSDSITATFYVVEALASSGNLASIDAVDLEDWLRECVITGSDTSDSDQWGGVGAYPTDGSARNSYAASYVESLWLLGKAHTDPLKLTEWIQSTAVGDGSFTDSVGPDQQVTLGTASALTTMSVLGTLGFGNKTAGLSWFLENQLDSGSFGVSSAMVDIVGKTWTASAVARSLERMGETSGAVAANLLSYCSDITTSSGFEPMEILPSLMWTYWLARAATLSHSQLVSLDRVRAYLDSFVGYGFAMYPGWGNITKTLPPEYAYQQYYDRGVWAQYFGLATASAIGWQVPASVKSDIALYLALTQTSGGHFKPSSSGTASMQYSVAAIEALYVLDELDTMWFRSALETAIMARYAGGQWSASGWSLEPFSGSQSAIDFLSTRAALRLDLITAIMAEEIRGVLLSRIQYDDIVSLSWDVESLALLAEAGFDVDLTAISEPNVLSALSSSFSNGWLNSTSLWQPIYTARALELASVLGLRARVLQIEGDSIVLSVPTSVFSGSSLSLGVTIGSGTGGHRVLVYAFGGWTEFLDVQGSDTLSVEVPSHDSYLGAQRVFAMLSDYGASRAFDDGVVSVLLWTDTELSLGGVPLDALLGDSFTIWSQLRDDSGCPVSGESLIITVTYLPSTVVLQQVLTTNASGHVSLTWAPMNPGEYSVCAEFAGSTGMGECSESIPTFVRIPTSLGVDMPSGLEVGVPSWIMITTSGMGSQPINVEVEVTLMNPSGTIVFHELVTTVDGEANFTWIPSARGLNNISVHLARQGWFEESTAVQTKGVYERPSIQVDFLDDIVAPTSSTVKVSVAGFSTSPIEGALVTVALWIDGDSFLDTQMTTEADGAFLVDLPLVHPGQMFLIVSVHEDGWLLSSSEQVTEPVLGRSSIVISIPGAPIEQGTTLGIAVGLQDWADAPLVGASVTISVTWGNGTVIENAVVLTGAGGTCSIGHEFRVVGDFWIVAEYEGIDMNSSAIASRMQRVHLAPNLVLSHNPSCIVRTDTEFAIGLTDVYGVAIVGRPLLLSVHMGGVTVYEVALTSTSQLITLHWTPESRGLVLVFLSHSGDEFFLANSTSGVMSSVAMVEGELEADADEVDLFSSVAIKYTLTSYGSPASVEIRIQVLGMDLVPVWTTSGLTDQNGVLTLTYTALHCHGILQIVGAPSEDQFMLGGDAQVSLKVWTGVDITTEMTPFPPTTGTEITVTVEVLDDLGLPVDGLRIAISVYDIYYSRLFTQYRDTVDGEATVTLVPSKWGVYRIGISSSGSETVHSFTANPDDHMHTIYCPTQITLVVNPIEVEVGGSVTISAFLTNALGSPLGGMSINLTIEGDQTYGPVSKTTDGAGAVTWILVLDEQGFWELRAQFFGLGTYLPALETLDLHSCYGTSILLERNNDTEAIAGVTPMNVSVLLVDSAENPLEGRTICWEVYNDRFGLVDSGSFVQLGIEPEIFVLAFERGGNTTVVFSFLGSDHYHSSNAAVDLIVLGTTEAVYLGPLLIDRGNETKLEIEVMNEVGVLLPVGSLLWSVSFTGPRGQVNLTDRVAVEGTRFSLTTLGLAVGDYSLCFEVSNTSSVVGSELLIDLSVVSQTSVRILEADLPGILGDQHIIVLGLFDSLQDSLDGLTLLVSLYHPDGREIYGGLGSYTPVVLDGGCVEISWTPTATGNYSLVVRFDGDDWLLPSAYAEIVLTRRSTALETEIVPSIMYPTAGEVSVALTSGIGRLSGVQVTLCITGSGMENIVSATDSRGEVHFVLPILLAGEYMLEVLFNGTDVFAPVSTGLHLVVLPRVVADVLPESTLYVGMQGLLQVSFQGLGLSDEWNGTIRVLVVSPAGEGVLNESWFSGPSFTESIEFLPEFLGHYQLNLTITGLPVLSLHAESFTIVVGPPPIHLTLDVATTPVAAAIPIVGLLALILKKRFGIELPTDWAGS
jgi:prenyltransferase beta subunit